MSLRSGRPHRGCKEFHAILVRRFRRPRTYSTKYASVLENQSMLGMLAASIAFTYSSPAGICAPQQAHQT